MNCLPEMAGYDNDVHERNVLVKKFTAVKFKCLLVTNDEMRDHIFEQSSTVQSSAKGGALDSLEHLEEVLLLKSTHVRSERHRSWPRGNRHLWESNPGSPEILPHKESSLADDVFEIPRFTLDYLTNTPETPANNPEPSEDNPKSSTNNLESPTNNSEYPPSILDSLPSGPGSPNAASEPSTPDPGTVQIYNPDSGLAVLTRNQKNHLV
nr:hypothetical protein Iba_chr01aCG5600 [Ipomoea batatas]